MADISHAGELSIKSGTVESLAGSKCYVFQMDHFSIYTLVRKIAAAPPTEGSKPTPTSEQAVRVLIKTDKGFASILVGAENLFMVAIQVIVQKKHHIISSKYS